MDEELVWIARAQQGNDEAFTRLVEAYQRPVYNLCYRMLGEPEAAEDAAQETFLRVYQHLDQYDQERSFTTWLLSIAAHYCIDLSRRSRLPIFSIDQENEGSSQLPDSAASNPESEVLHREQSEQIQVLLKRLNAVDRAAVVMHYWQNFSEAEIALILHITANAVKSRLHRARRELATAMHSGMSGSHQEGRLHELHAF